MLKLNALKVQFERNKIDIYYDFLHATFEHKYKYKLIYYTLYIQTQKKKGNNIQLKGNVIMLKH